MVVLKCYSGFLHIETYFRSTTLKFEIGRLCLLASIFCYMTLSRCPMATKKIHSIKQKLT